MSATYGAALFAAIVAIAATVAIERFGGKIGGLLGSLPTTIIPASIGFWYAATDVSSFRDSLFAVPVGMGVTSLFLYSWRVLPGRFSFRNLKLKLVCMTSISIAIWSGCAMMMVLAMRQVQEHMGTVALLSTLGLVVLGVWACINNPPAPKGNQRVSPWMLLARGSLAGTAIGISVWIAGLGVPLLAGIASVFPAIFLTTMVSVWVSQGEAVQAGAVGPMMLGSSSVAVYAVVAAFSFPQWSLFTGCIVAWLSAVFLISVPAWWWLRER